MSDHPQSAALGSTNSITGVRDPHALNELEARLRRLAVLSRHPDVLECVMEALAALAGVPPFASAADVEGLHAHFLLSRRALSRVDGVPSDDLRRLAELQSYARHALSRVVLRSRTFAAEGTDARA